MTSHEIFALQKNKKFIGKIYLTPDGIIIKNDQGEEFFKLDEIDKLMAYFAKKLLNQTKGDEEEDICIISPDILKKWEKYTEHEAYKIYKNKYKWISEKLSYQLDEE